MRRISAQATWGLSDDGVIQAVADSVKKDIKKVALGDDVIRVRIVSERDYRLLTRAVRAAERYYMEVSVSHAVVAHPAYQAFWTALDTLNAPGKGRR